ncbi:hypothetical protein TRIP_B330188 [uncultured Desulfatiglans sp.]|uniref:Uncharacterized protein n=1 Tax=Uncultured Desulfatiglans sp. TaxID=1748965 RepID=A0A653A7N0_UNCDX|nr:hypothetical protein TRIP_B330188 [uncultured Desulfatiglans sp.]
MTRRHPPAVIVLAAERHRFSPIFNPLSRPLSADRRLGHRVPFLERWIQNCLKTNANNQNKTTIICYCIIFSEKDFLDALRLSDLQNNKVLSSVLAGVKHVFFRIFLLKQGNVR